MTFSEIPPLVWQIPLALWGLQQARGFPTLHFGHGRWRLRAGGLILSLLMVAPLASSSVSWTLIVACALCAVLVPYRALALRRSASRAAEGLRQLCEQSSGAMTLERDGELLSARMPSTDTETELRIHNVLTHVRSLHPGVDTRQTIPMLAIVKDLAQSPGFEACFLRGWGRPNYFEREWRESTILMGSVLAMNLGTSQLSASGDPAAGRETGAVLANLQPLPGFDPASQAGVAAYASGELEELQRLLEGEFWGLLHEALPAGRGFECNVTPTSLLVYTASVGATEQRAIVRLLDLIAESLSGPPEQS